MIEIIPEKVERAFLYFHSAGTNSVEFEPYLETVKRLLPNTYIWIGDGHISGSPLLYNNSYYGDSEERYWFMFPMQDASSRESFYQNREAMGASLMSAGSFVNSIVDQVKSRFNLSTDKITLSGFQHGSSLVLSTAMMRKNDPFKSIILFEPYLLEAFCFESEPILKETKVICVENSFIRNRTYNWLGIYTDAEFQKMGFEVKSIVTEEGDNKLDKLMVEEALKNI